MADRGAFPEETSTEAEEPIRSAVTMFRDAGVVNALGEGILAPRGHVAKAVLDRAHKHDVAVIILGTRGLSDLEAALIVSTAHKVIHLAD
jgi:nucleotide-binding universal stress UspA family protein